MSKKHSKMSLPVQMVIGLVLGVIVGSMTSAEFTAAYLRPFGQLFITLIRMVVVPLVLATIIAGAAGIHDLSKLGRVATKTLVYYFLTTGVAVAIGLFLANIMQPGIGLDVTRQTVLCTTPFSFGMRKLEKSILWHTVCINRKRGVCSRRSVYAASPRSG